MFSAIGKILIKLLGGTRNERIIRGIRDHVVAEVNVLEARFRDMSAEQLHAVTDQLRVSRRPTLPPRPSPPFARRLAAQWSTASSTCN